MSLADREDDENERVLPMPGMHHIDARRGAIEFDNAQCEWVTGRTRIRSETDVQRSSAIGGSSPSTKLIEVRPGKLIVARSKRSEHE
jgi:hypothetical protein